MPNLPKTAAWRWRRRAKNARRAFEASDPSAATPGRSRSSSAIDDELIAWANPLIRLLLAAPDSIADFLSASTRIGPALHADSRIDYSSTT
jgi:hypothetical protein